ncbi:MAG: hypothetical protein ABSC94_01925 [Polyangiaceae bacterium]|jgi:hypothetical protein
MNRSSAFATTALYLVLMTACDNAATDEKKAAAAQTEANDKSGAATKEAEDKITGAQAEADQKMAAAQADFMKLRENFRHTTTTNLVELDQKVADLTASAGQFSGKKRVAFDANLKQIHASRETFESDYRLLQGTSGAAWDEVKARLEKEWTELKALVDKA